MSDIAEYSTTLPRDVAVIDLGSNSVRAFAAHHAGDGVFEITADRAIQPRLGAPVDQTGKMDSAAMEHVADFVGSFIAPHGPFDEIHCLGTAAVREADNTPFLTRRLKEKGVELTVISGEREAELTLRGALFAIECHCATSTPRVVDVGGNSTEISKISNDELQVACIALGAVRLTDRCLLQDPITPGNLQRARELAAEFLEPHHDLLQGSEDVVGAGGTAVTLGLLCDRWEVARDELCELTEGLAAMSLSQRRELMSFDPERAEIIVGGLILLGRAMDISPSKHAHISTGGLREGVLVEIGATQIRRKSTAGTGWK